MKENLMNVYRLPPKKKENKKKVKKNHKMCASDMHKVKNDKENIIKQT